MQNISDNELDQFFKETAEKYDIPFEEASWSKLEQMLDDDRKPASAFRKGRILSLLLLLLLPLSTDHSYKLTNSELNSNEAVSHTADRNTKYIHPSRSFDGTSASTDESTTETTFISPQNKLEPSIGSYALAETVPAGVKEGLWPSARTDERTSLAQTRSGNYTLPAKQFNISSRKSTFTLHSKDTKTILGDQRDSIAYTEPDAGALAGKPIYPLFYGDSLRNASSTLISQTQPNIHSDKDSLRQEKKTSGISSAIAIRSGKEDAGRNNHDTAYVQENLVNAENTGDIIHLPISGDIAALRTPVVPSDSIEHSASSWHGQEVQESGEWITKSDSLKNVKTKDTNNSILEGNAIAKEKKNEELMNSSGLALIAKSDSLENVKTKDTTGMAMAAKEVAKEKKSEEGTNILSKISLGLVVAPDFTSAGFFTLGKPGLAEGLFAQYMLTSRWAVTAGIIRSSKVYTSKEGYNATDGYWKYKSKPDRIEGSCNVLDLPLNIKYHADGNPEHNLFFSAGMSSYIMLKERYVFVYDKTNTRRSYDYKKRNIYFMGIVNLSFGYERKLNKRFWAGLEPFLKVPLKPVGAGEAQLVTSGIHLHIRYALR